VIAKCRPALNYYLLCQWPGEFKDDSQSRFINERAHANIQKDATYSVIPRMWGGETTPAELRAIADAAEKYKVKTVHITGGQRISLFGLKKEELPKIWGDLNEAGLVSGHAYGKALRTVKTCVGQEWCRFGTQDSTQMGIDLEKMTWGSWTPHKYKMAVSGCPRNCAEATIKDFGVVCVDSGYELHVGGNGGIKVRATEYLCAVSTPEQVKEYAAALMQLYREEAHYLERTAPWLERVGLTYVKEKIVEDDEGRKALAERFLYAQKFSQDDPWAERAEGGEAHEFTLEDIPRQGAGGVSRAEGDMAIFRTVDDELFALRDKCPHKGGPLSQGIVHGKRVACPLHDWKINLDSGDAVAPDEGCAARYPVKIEGGVIRLSLTPDEGCQNK